MASWSDVVSVEEHAKVVAKRDRLREVLKQAYDDLRFNRWENDPESNRRFEAVHKAGVVLRGENADSTRHNG